MLRDPRVLIPVLRGIPAPSSCGRRSTARSRETVAVKDRDQADEAFWIAPDAVSNLV
jgi:hypothetical protein